MESKNNNMSRNQFREYLRLLQAFIIHLFIYFFNNLSLRIFLMNKGKCRSTERLLQGNDWICVSQRCPLRER